MEALPEPTQHPTSSRSILERAVLHFEQRGARARAHAEHLLHHHRGRAADRLDQRIEHARRQLNAFAEKSKEISSKIRPEVPTNS